MSLLEIQFLLNSNVGAHKNDFQLERQWVTRDVELQNFCGAFLGTPAQKKTIIDDCRSDKFSAKISLILFLKRVLFHAEHVKCIYMNK